MNEQSVNTCNDKTECSKGITNLVLGVVVVFVGAVLLARNLGVDIPFFYFDRWWALFILIGAVGPLYRAYSVHRLHGWNSEVAGALVGALSIITVALLFLLHLSFGTWWPVFVMLGGLFMLSNHAKSN